MQAQEESAPKLNSYWRHNGTTKAYILVAAKPATQMLDEQYQVKDMGSGRLHWVTRQGLASKYTHVSDSLLGLYGAATGQAWQAQADDQEEVEDAD